MKRLALLMAGIVSATMIAACATGGTPTTGTTDSKAAATAPAKADTKATGPAASPAAKSAASPAAKTAASPATKTAASPAAKTAASPAASPQTAAGFRGSPLPKAAEGTALRRIQDRGRLIAGVKYDVPTFGYLNPQTNQLEGFDVELAKGIANYIFGDPEAIEFKQAVSRDRVPFLEQDVVDIIASTMTINAEREQQIDFSRPYYVAGQSLLVPKNSPITGINDLSGKTVATVTGSTSEQNIREKAPNAQVVLFPTYSEAVQAMDSGRADAVTTDDIILYGYVKQSPDKYKVVGGQFTVEPYGIGVKKGNQELLEAVNNALTAMMADGRWAQIYQNNLPVETVPTTPPLDWRSITQAG